MTDRRTDGSSVRTSDPDSGGNMQHTYDRVGYSYVTGVSQWNWACQGVTGQGPATSMVAMGGGLQIN